MAYICPLRCFYFASLPLHVVCEPFENCGRCIFSAFISPKRHSASAFSFHIFHCLFFLPSPPSPLSIHLFPVLFVAFIHSNQGRQLECERESAPALFYFPRPCAKNNNRNGVGELVGGWLTGWVGGCGVCFGGNAWKKSIKQLMPNEWQALPISTYPRNRNGNENRQQSNPVRKNKHDDDVLDGEGWTARGRAVEERTIAINRSRSQGIKDD